MGATSNALRTSNDLGAAAGTEHQAGALIFVDAVHHAPHYLPDLRPFGWDFFACSAHKFNGLHIVSSTADMICLRSIDVPKLRRAHDPAPGEPKRVR